MMDLGSVVVDVGLVVVLDYWGGDNLDLVVILCFDVWQLSRHGNKASNLYGRLLLCLPMCVIK